MNSEPPFANSSLLGVIAYDDGWFLLLALSFYIRIAREPGLMLGFSTLLFAESWLEF